MSQRARSGTEHTKRHRARRSGCTRTEATLSGMQLCAAHGAASSAAERYPGTQSIAEYHDATGSSRSTWSGAVRCIARRSYTEKPERHGAAQNCTERYEAQWSPSTARSIQSARSSTDNDGALRSATERYGALRSATERYGALRSATERYGAPVALRSATERYRALRDAMERDWLKRAPVPLPVAWSP